MTHGIAGNFRAGRECRRAARLSLPSGELERVGRRGGAGEVRAAHQKPVPAATGLPPVLPGNAAAMVSR